MQTLMDVDERLLSMAEQQARSQGKTLGAFVEEALRSVLQPLRSQTHDETKDPIEIGLSDDDPFFCALEEVRELGHLPAKHRQIGLH